jgi:hypothetical protein
LGSPAAGGVAQKRRLLEVTTPMRNLAGWNEEEPAFPKPAHHTASLGQNSQN